jgi:uncharacterized protein YigA (DUF484 family)
MTARFSLMIERSRAPCDVGATVGASLNRRFGAKLSTIILFSISAHVVASAFSEGRYDISMHRESSISPHSNAFSQSAPILGNYLNSVDGPARFAQIVYNLASLGFFRHRSSLPMR